MPTKGEFMSHKWRFSPKLTTVVLGRFSCLPLYLKSWQQAHNTCPAILNKTFSNHFLPGWFLPLTTSIISPCQNPLSYFDPSSRTQTSRIRQNLPLFTRGMRNIDHQTSTLQCVSSSTIDMYLTTQHISTDTARSNLSLTVWGKFSTQTKLKTAHTHISKNYLSTARWQLQYILFHIPSSLW